MQYGCIGEHLPHSFSKIIHEKIENYHYILKELTPNEVAPFIQSKDFSGINVTIPYKQTVIPFLDEIDDMAKAIGAVNTVVNRNGKLYGYNTDFAGLSALVQKIGLNLKNKKVLIIGTGGTAKTAHAVAKAGAARAIFHLSPFGEAGAIGYRDAYQNHSDAEIVINTSPCGMFPKIESFPTDENQKPFDFDAFPSLEGVADVVYNPLRTRFVLEAKKRGLPAEGGLYMLVAQAVFAAEHFTGKQYPRSLIDEIFSSLVAEKENIVLIGMPGSGKSTVSSLLASKIGYHMIDTDAMILRKGAVSAQVGERLIIPMNMRDGCLICVGKGNPDWNYSAPHGAGRLMSRAESRQSFTLSQFKKEMQGIYTTSVSRETLDESPMAYKPMDSILAQISPTVDVIEQIRPVYNFKAGEDER